MPKKLTTEEFINRAKEIHGDRYDYSKVEYKNSHTKIQIRCSVHGIFLQAPTAHLAGRGCVKCFYNNKNINKSKRISVIDFCKRANKKHNNYYDYSKVTFTRLSDKIEIICPQHGSFWQIANHHVNGGRGCRKCSLKSSKKFTTQQFITKSKQIHGDYYNYSQVNYISNYHSVTIICPFHGPFLQVPSSHLRNYGCPSCGPIKAAASKTQLPFKEVLIHKFYQQIHQTLTQIEDFAPILKRKTLNKIHISLDEINKLTDEQQYQYALLLKNDLETLQEKLKVLKAINDLKFKADVQTS